MASPSNAARFARPTKERTGMAPAPVGGGGPDGVALGRLCLLALVLAAPAGRGRLIPTK